MSKTFIKEVTIASSGTTSDAVEITRSEVVGIRFPATLTGTAVSFLTSESYDGTYIPLYDDAGNLFTVTPTGALAIASLNPAEVVGLLNYVKIVSNATEGAARTLAIVYKELY